MVFNSTIGKNNLMNYQYGEEVFENKEAMKSFLDNWDKHKTLYRYSYKSYFNKRHKVYLD